jgi:hypothetical protein
MKKNKLLFKLAGVGLAGTAFLGVGLSTVKIDGGENISTETMSAVAIPNVTNSTFTIPAPAKI